MVSFWLKWQFGTSMPILNSTSNHWKTTLNILKFYQLTNMKNFLISCTHKNQHKILQELKNKWHCNKIQILYVWSIGWYFICGNKIIYDFLFTEGLTMHQQSEGNFSHFNHIFHFYSLHIDLTIQLNKTKLTSHFAANFPTILLYQCSWSLHLGQ